MTTTFATFTRTVALSAALAFSAGLLTACEEEGPAEQLGENIDNTVEKAGDKIEDATD